MYKLLFVLGSTTCFCFYSYGIFFKIVNIENNECQMTYMFEYPHYERIKFSENKKFPKYGLYAYGEGVFIEKLQRRIFNGCPVIFIPGNAGSYKQVRSLASVALRKAIDIRWNKHLDYFSVDLNEEYSGLFGGYLEQQKNFTKLCILTIMSLYKNLKNRRKQLIVIGHSMGGKIAQSLLTDDTISKYINTIINLATPMDEPVINLDIYIDSFYTKVNSYFLTQSQRKIIAIATFNNNQTNYVNTIGIQEEEEGESNKIKNKIVNDELLISIGGGNRDYLVHEGLTSSKYSDINVLTYNIPNVWLSADHLCTVWCLQLMLVINRFLFSLIDYHHNNNNYKKGIDFIQDKQVKIKKAEQYFINSIEFPNDENNLKIYPESADWHEDSRRLFVEHFPHGIKKNRIQMIRLLNDIQHAVLSVRTINVNVDNWIFGCDAYEIAGTKRVCSNLTGLSYTMETLPSVDSNNHFVTLDLESIRAIWPQWTHILLYMRPSKRKMKLYVDIYGRADRSTIIPYSMFSVHKRIIANVNFYRILLPDLLHVYQVSKLTINPIDCQHSYHNLLAKLCAPWNKGSDKYYFLRDTKNAFVYATSEKPDIYNFSEYSMYVDLHLDANCTYNLSFENSFGGMASQIVQQYPNRIFSYIVIMLIVILQSNITRTSFVIASKNMMFSLFIPSKKSIFFVYVTTILTCHLSWFDNNNYPPSQSNKNQSIFITSILMGVAFAIVSISFVILALIINLLSAIIRLISKIRKFNCMISQSHTENLYFLLFTILILVSLIFCGGIGFIFACFIYAIFITRKYEQLLVSTTSKYFPKEYEKNLKIFKKAQTEEEIKSNRIEDQSYNFIHVDDKNEIGILFRKTINALKNDHNMKSTNKLDEGLHAIYIHMSLLMMLIFLTSLNLPSTISWIKNIKFTKVLNPDPSLVPSILSLVSLNWICELPLPENRNFRYFSWILNWYILYCILYCQQSVFLLNSIINNVFILICISQMFI